MKWIKFDFNDESTWPTRNSLVIIRYRNKHQRICYLITEWNIIFKKRYANQSIRDHLYFTNYEDVMLEHDDSKVTCWNSFITHWTYLDEPTDGYWEAYKHDNGNTYADVAYRTNKEQQSSFIDAGHGNKQRGKCYEIKNNV